MTRDLAAEVSAALPVSVLTGALGSGKTTLLNRLLEHPALGETAVVINEFGEVGLDHLLVRHVSETVVLLDSGCLCCTVRGDLVTALRDLFLRRVRGEVPEFRRLVIETSGLADPAPVLHTLISDPLIGARYRLDGVIATVDAVHAGAQLSRQPETRKQVAVADRIVLTKTDLAAPDAVEDLRARLRELNPAAPTAVAIGGDVSPDLLFEAGLFSTRGKLPDVARWLNEEAYHGHHHAHGSIQSFCLTFAEPLDWEPFAASLERLIAERGEDLLRVKGILNVAGEDRPLAVHGVQHLFHPPTPLPGWPDGDRRSRIVFITRDLGRDAVAAAISPDRGGGGTRGGGIPA